MKRMDFCAGQGDRRRHSRPVEGGAGSARHACGCDPAAVPPCRLSAGLWRAYMVAFPQAGPLLCASARHYGNDELRGNAEKAVVSCLDTCETDH